MYLKKLSIQGFKSFANRTTFEFRPGVTAIVGPNGSGKSNVADAIRWVLGEQSTRLLRAKKSEDVIFTGTSKRAAVGMAEVMLTLDNEDKWLPLDFAEVELGRRVYRNGDSEYLLNGSRVRLRDLVDILMKADVGQNSYTIMGQGLVDEVLSMNPDERRSFLDEAADVKRFRMKIREAYARLEATRDNMARVELVIGEIEPRLSQLERQASRADDHRKLSAELADLLKTFYGERWSIAQNDLVRSRATLDQRIAEKQEAELRVTQLREQIQALGDEITRRREAISRRDTRAAEFEGRLAATEQAIHLDRERHAMMAGRREEVQLELQALEAERLTLGSTDVDEGRRGIEVVAEVDQAKTMVRDARELLEQAEREYATARGKAQELRDGADADERRLGGNISEAEAAERRLLELEHELAQAVARRKAVLVELIGYGRRFKELRQAVADAESVLSQARADAEQARARLIRVQDEVRSYEAAGNDDLRELNHLEGRLDALQRVQAEHDGVATGTRNVLIMGQALIDGIEPGSLGEPPELHGVVGLLARQLRVPAGLEVAINAALEQRLHAVVIEREEDALKAIDALSRRGSGRAQFLPLDSVRQVYPLNLQKERGVLGVASKLVRCENKVRPLVDTLLGRVIVVDDIETGLRMIRRSLGSVVTVGGTFIEPTGVISGGSSGAEEGAFSRQNELDELPQRIAELRERTNVGRQQLETGREALEQLSLAVREKDDHYDQLRKSGDTHRLELERERDRLHRLRRDMDALTARKADIGRERAECETRALRSRQEIARLEERRDERRRNLGTVEEDLTRASERREAALRAMSESSGRLASIEGEQKALEAMRQQHEKAIERLANQISSRRLQGKNLELEAAGIEERIAGLQRQMEGLRVEQSQFADDAAPDRDELRRLENHERTVNDDLARAQNDLLQTERSRLDVEAEVARAEERIENLKLEMEREGLAPDRSGAIVPVDEAMDATPMFEQPAEAQQHIRGSAIVDLNELHARIEDVRRQIRRLGPINEEAPEDYRESRERYDFLTGQMADLRDAEAQLREAIDELSQEIKARFTDAFHKVDKAFGEYFSAFFGGGEAKLLLTSPDNIAESGIDIQAQPPGKRINSLSMLSGGERSLTAVALLFALLTVNPAPFCVLDEVDAALDEANVGRFTTALTKLSEKTQFLAVTHNRKTVEAGDSIYGISMGPDGVSKVLSLRLSDLPKE
jgi:chromosome segregation protein